jgi:hypothetical protein
VWLRVYQDLSPSGLDYDRARVPAWTRAVEDRPRVCAPRSGFPREALRSSAAVPATPPNESGHEAAHDILAAEAFAVPAPDPRLGHELVLPDDPAGIPEPHDILAAEEFAMPAPEGSLAGRAREVTAGGARWTALAGAGGLLVLWLRRLRR